MHCALLCQLYVVDVMNFSVLRPSAHGVLIPVGSPLAVEYKRTGGFSYGGASVLGHTPVLREDDAAVITAGELLGRGAFGDVHKAKPRGSDPAAECSLAVKVVRLDDPRWPVAMAMREVEVMTTVAHRNIVAYKTHFTTKTPARLFMVMELAVGSAASHLVEPHRLSWLDKALLLLDVARAMRHLHGEDAVEHKARPFVHRDLK